VAVIKSFQDKATAKIWDEARDKRLDAAVQKQAMRKLQLLDAATSLMDLRSPPGNRLEQLRGCRAGQWSIRVNDQYRICFGWDDGAVGVEFTDYH